ncbi:MAG: sulfur oxidation c-type cytochrome SoxX [Pseudomonadales bacterium]|nr:sulfur oxidation c-type cytochrome SoxX [Pseudomonadales bacterium]
MVKSVAWSVFLLLTGFITVLSHPQAQAQAQTQTQAGAQDRVETPGLAQNLSEEARIERGRALAYDPDRGDCTICHQLDQQNASNQGTIGPPLTGVGQRYDRQTLISMLTDMRAFNPATLMPPFGSTQGLQNVAEHLQGQTRLRADEIAAIADFLLAGDRP